MYYVGLLNINNQKIALGKIGTSYIMYLKCRQQAVGQFNSLTALQENHILYCGKMHSFLKCHIQHLHENNLLQ